MQAVLYGLYLQNRKIVYILVEETPFNILDGSL